MIEMKKFLELNAAKRIDYIEKCFKQKLHRIKFATENSVDANLDPPWSGARDSKDFLPFQCIITFQKRKSLKFSSHTPEIDRDMRPLSFL